MAQSTKSLDKLTAVRFEQTVLDRLAQIGAEMDRPMSWLIRHAVDKFIASYKPAKKS
ncbi:MAG TPA: hypothetical protein VNV41_16460 [Candidatus Acidoferrales bacterium]|jgi:hypothetical protein|nr:hypothetical protein [Candidatus Acidoferrales bacterium]